MVCHTQRGPPQWETAGLSVWLCACCMAVVHVQPHQAPAQTMSARNRRRKPNRLYPQALPGRATSPVPARGVPIAIHQGQQPRQPRGRAVGLGAHMALPATAGSYRPAACLPPPCSSKSPTCASQESLVVASPWNSPHRDATLEAVAYVPFIY